MIEGNKR